MKSSSSYFYRWQKSREMKRREWVESGDYDTQSYLFDMQIDLSIQTIVFARILFKRKLLFVRSLAYPSSYIVLVLSTRCSKAEMIRFGATHIVARRENKARGAS